MKFLYLLIVLLSITLHASNDTTKIILGGHMYGVDKNGTVTGYPAESFIIGVDKYPKFEPNAYIAGGDLTCDATEEQWDNLYNVFKDKWSFNFIPAIGNHDLLNIEEWEKRIGDTYRTVQIASTYIILLHSIEYPNGSLSDKQSSWLNNQIIYAENNDSINDIIIAQHHLFWTKSFVRYENIYQLGNAWYCEYRNQGYDVNSFVEESWPKIKSLAQKKSVTFFAGDGGYTYGDPSIFYDTIDNVKLISCGYNAYSRKKSDAVILYKSYNGQISLESISPYDTTFEDVEYYNLNYWNDYFKKEPSKPNEFDTCHFESQFIEVPSGTFNMGCHINPRNLKYIDNTGHNVTLSSFFISKNEITVSEYLNFLNYSDATKKNDYHGYFCIDLSDPDCQIEKINNTFISKDSNNINHPIIEVSWYGAIAYCNYLSEIENLDKCYSGINWDIAKNGYRLPTDAEFEYAQRGGEGYTKDKNTYYRFYWSDNSSDHVHEHANYYGTKGRDKWEGLSPIASFPPNPFGLYDITGNAFEWVYDRHTPWYDMKGIVTNPINFDKPFDFPNDTIRTIRGGGFNFHWSACTNYYRSGELAKKANSYIGFRVARGSIKDNSITASDKVLMLNEIYMHNNILSFNIHPSHYNELEINLLNIQGRRILNLSKFININPGRNVIPMPKLNYSKGVYLLQFKIGKSYRTHKIIIR